jgi:shikimate dehydrogenase
VSDATSAPSEPQRYAVLGSPIAHSLSPVLQQAAFAAAGIRATYAAFDVPLAEVDGTVGRLRAQSFAGWNVTTPLKEAMLTRVDALTIEARDIGAVNVVRREDDARLTGHNTDGAGFVRGLVELWEWQPAAARVLLLGSGPAAAAIAYALRQAGVTALSCWSRSQEKALALAPPPAAPAGLVVSALPSTAVVPAAILRWAAPGCDVVDLNYAASESPVSAVAAKRRANGLAMLLHQGALSFEWWTGRAAPLAAMRTALAL